MECHPRGFEDLLDRLANLEKQNRRFKLLGCAALVGVTLLLVMGQAPSKKIVEANEFILRDDSGNIRARLSVDYVKLGGMPQMVFLDTNGNTNLELDGGVAGVFGGVVGISDLQGRRVGTFFSSGSGGSFSISRGWSFPARAEVVLTPGSVEIMDDQGFEAVVGTEDLVTPTTGETHKTSAASLVLLDKNKGVIWKAP